MLQGAAVAAVLCAQQQRASRALPDPMGSGSDAQPWPLLRFVVLCSGFASPCPEHQRLLAAEAPLRLPSLHIYGAQRHADRQARYRFGISRARSSCSSFKLQQLCLRTPLNLSWRQLFGM